MSAVTGSQQLQRLLYLVVPFVVLLALWQLLTAAGIVDPFLISSPTRVFPALVDQVKSGELTRALGTTALEFAVSFALASVVGVALGVLMGWYKPVEFALDPFVWLIYSAPVIAMYPVFLVLFGAGLPTIVAVSFFLTVSPIVVNTMRGVQEVDPRLVRAARSLMANDRQLFRYVAIPGAVPLIMAGLRIGVGRALTAVIVAEIFAGDGGLGYIASYYAGLQQTTDMLADVIVIAALGVAVTQLLRVLESRADRWRVDSARR
ncbi:MAG TPA: ABC transporter permease [Conexibacter sp.]